MSEIKVLDEKTIDKIAAGEVVEKPASVVKELVENAIDAGACSISVEVKNGGTDLIRVSDNGDGIVRDQVRTAFLPHATSKLRKIEDLETIESLGFRGEALPSIASVSQVELLTKTVDEITGVRYCIDGGTEQSFDEVGVPDGTTFIVRNLFFNTPARKKFLKTAMTETGYVTELVEQLALLRPDIAFKYTANSSNKLVTSGNGDLKEVIYRIYGRDITSALLEVEKEEDGMTIHGFIAKPVIARSSRNMENYFVNGRYVKDKVISRAIEDGYSGFMMQHKFPFTVLSINVPTELLDVNVHPRKMEVKFGESEKVYDFIRNAVKESLSGREFINKFDFEKTSSKIAEAPKAPEKAPEPFEKKAFGKPFKETVIKPTVFRNDLIKKAVNKEEGVQNVLKEPALNLIIGRNEDKENSDKGIESVISKELNFEIEDDINYPSENNAAERTEKTEDNISDNFDLNISESISENNEADNNESDKDVTFVEKPRQMNLFEDKILDKNNADEFEIIGQIFDTYWIVQYHDKMLMIDQHAAHEKINYERFMKKFEERRVDKQICSPSVIITLDGAHRNILERFMDRFEEMGFEIEPFGGNDFAIKAVPGDLYGLTEEEILISLLDELDDGIKVSEVSAIHDRIATMSCKAAVKGNMKLSREEAKMLIAELMELKDPYNCPHGRPTIIQMSKSELEKKFKRII
ncbi:DNA mismatch repair endonuclease MutL [Lachnospiraceae bacterium C1.1]|nr:DNA mismatch repair endonuclease MutL [Lachnospiraceae bacterium C1.1]